LLRTDEEQKETKQMEFERQKKKIKTQGLVTKTLQIHYTARAFSMNNYVCCTIGTQEALAISSVRPPLHHRWFLSVGRETRGCANI
jgi:hypothetical protein